MGQSGALQWPEIMMLLRQLSYAVKNQLKAGTRGKVFLGISWFFMAYMRHNNTAEELCCYGIDLGTSIVKFNQWKQSISRIPTNESAPLWRSSIPGYQARQRTVGTLMRAHQATSPGNTQNSEPQSSKYRSTKDVFYLRGEHQWRIAFKRTEHLRALVGRR